MTRAVIQTPSGKFKDAHVIEQTELFITTSFGTFDKNWTWVVDPRFKLIAIIGCGFVTLRQCAASGKTTSQPPLGIEAWEAVQRCYRPSFFDRVFEAIETLKGFLDTDPIELRYCIPHEKPLLPFSMMCEDCAEAAERHTRAQRGAPTDDEASDSN